MLCGDWAKSEDRVEGAQGVKEMRDVLGKQQGTQGKTVTGLGEDEQGSTTLQYTRLH